MRNLKIMGICMLYLLVNSCSKKESSIIPKSLKSNVPKQTNWVLGDPIVNGVFVISNPNSQCFQSGAADVVQQNLYGGYYNQQWNITRLGSGLYKIINHYTGKAMTAPSGTSGAQLICTTYTGAATQVWAIPYLAWGQYKITNASNGFAITLDGNSTAYQAKITQTNYTTTDGSQTWTFTPVTYANPTRSYTFNGNMTRAVLESYLSRALQMYEFNVAPGKSLYNSATFTFVNPHRTDDKRMILNLGAKFIGRSIIVSNNEDDIVDSAGYFGWANTNIASMHAAAPAGDPDIIFQAGLMETVSTKINLVKIPTWVLAVFGQPVVTNRYFDYTNIRFTSGTGWNFGGTGNYIPDMTRMETQMWFYYLARTYINIGIESFHFGQIELMTQTDKNTDYTGLKNVLSKIRTYAGTYARRHKVLFDAHVPSGGIKDAAGNLFLDFHSCPLRIKEDGPQAQHGGILQVGFQGALYGRSMGGVNPNGWSCTHSPYLVEFDSYGSPSPGNPIGPPYVWGWDEYGWYGAHDEIYRNEWLNYAWNWIRTTDPNTGTSYSYNGFIILPGAGPVSSVSANTGLGNAEETIKMIWQNYQ